MRNYINRACVHVRILRKNVYRVRAGH